MWPGNSTGWVDANIGFNLNDNDRVVPPSTFFTVTNRRYLKGPSGRSMAASRIRLLQVRKRTLLLCPDRAVEL